MSNAKRVARKFIAGELPGLDITEASIYDVKNVSAPTNYLVDGTPLIFNKGTNKWEPKFFEAYRSTTTNNRFGIFVQGFKNLSSEVDLTAEIAMISTWGAVGTHHSSDLTVETEGVITSNSFKNTLNEPTLDVNFEISISYFKEEL